MKFIPILFNPIQPRKGSFVVSIINEVNKKEESDSSSNEGKKGTHKTFTPLYSLIFYSSTVLFNLLNSLYFTLPFSLKFIIPFLHYCLGHSSQLEAILSIFFKRICIYCKRRRFINCTFFWRLNLNQDTVTLSMRLDVITTISYSLWMIPKFSCIIFISYKFKII